MSEEEWRDARLKKALDSAPDADVRPADAVREAILHKARLTAAVAAQPAARRSPRLWRWLGSLAAVGALAVVLVGGRQLFLANQAAPEAAAPQVAQVARAPALDTADVAKPAATPPPGIVVADSRKEARPAAHREAARRKVEESAKQRAASAALPPPIVVAEATAPPPPPAAAPAPPPPPAAAPARAAAPAEPAWTELRIATADGPVTVRRDQLSAEAAGRLSRLLAAAESEQLRTQLADERQASGTAQAFARSPGVPGLLRIELLRGDQPVGSLVLRPGDPLRLELEAAAKPASAPSSAP